MNALDGIVESTHSHLAMIIAPLNMLVYDDDGPMELAATVSSVNSRHMLHLGDSHGGKKSLNETASF